MTTPSDIYTFLVSLTEMSMVEQAVFLFASTVVSTLIYLIKLSTGKISVKQWESFLIITIVFIIIPDGFYTYVWGFILK